MRWLDPKDTVGILMPVTAEDAALALPAAFSISAYFSGSRFCLSPETRDYLSVYLQGRDDIKPGVSVDLSGPPERSPRQPCAPISITTNPNNASWFNIFVRVESDDPLKRRAALLRTMGIPEVSSDWTMPGALRDAQVYIERSGYYPGRLRIFVDSENPKTENEFRTLVGTRAMFLKPGILGPAETLMLLAQSELYVGGRSVFTGFAFLFGKKCALTANLQVPEGSVARPLGNMKRTLERFELL